MRMMRWPAPELYCEPCCEGVYLINWGAPGPAGSVLGWAAEILPSTSRSRAARVSFVAFSASSSSGRSDAWTSVALVKSRGGTLRAAEGCALGVDFKGIVLSRSAGPSKLVLLKDRDLWLVTHSQRPGQRPHTSLSIFGTKAECSDAMILSLLRP